MSEDQLNRHGTNIVIARSEELFINKENEIFVFSVISPDGESHVPLFGVDSDHLYAGLEVAESVASKNPNVYEENTQKTRE